MGEEIRREVEVSGVGRGRGDGQMAMRMNGNLQPTGCREVGDISRKRQRPEIGEGPKNPKGVFLVVTHSIYMQPGEVAFCGQARTPMGREINPPTELSTQNLSCLQEMQELGWRLRG